MQKPTKIVLSIGIVLVAISIIVFGSSVGRSITGCIVSLILLPLSCCILVVGTLVAKNLEKESIPALPASDQSIKHPSDVTTERKPNTIFCPSCGKENKTDSVQCSFCDFEL